MGKVSILLSNTMPTFFCCALNTYIRDSSRREIFHSRNFLKGFASSVPELQGALDQHAYALAM
jgi:hypothetical protein